MSYIKFSNTCLFRHTLIYCVHTLVMCKLRVPAPVVTIDESVGCIA